MKTVTFIGAYDKTDLLIYIAKVLSTAKKRVLIIDSTIMQKMRYVVPSITQARSYITEFENIDFAIGYTNMNDIIQYLEEDIQEKYDIILFDIDSQGAMKSFDIYKNSINIFVTGFDVYSLKRGLSIIHNTMSYTNFSKIVFSKEMTNKENQFINFLSSQYNITWNDKTFYFPLELGNYAVTMENQTKHRIKMKGLSNNYKDALEYLIQDIFSDEIPSKEIPKLFKIVEKET